MLFQSKKNWNPEKTPFTSREKLYAAFNGSWFGKGVWGSVFLFLCALVLGSVFSVASAHDVSNLKISSASDQLSKSELSLDVTISAGLLSVREEAGKESFSGVWKPGRWVPFRVRLANAAGNTENSSNANSQSAERFTGKIVLEILDPDGMTAVTEQRIDCSLPCETELCVRFGTVHGNYRVKIFQKNTIGQKNQKKENSGTVPPLDGSVPNDLSEEFTLLSEISGNVSGVLPETKGVFLVVGAEDSGVTAGVAQMPSSSDLKPAVIRIPSARELPQNLAAWELIDLLVLSLDSETLRSWQKEDIQRLETWTRRGGNLVLSVGKSAELWANDPLWSAFQPGKLEKVIPVRETAAMEVFAKSPIPVTLLGVSEKFRIQVAKFTELQPEIQIHAEQFDLPLVMRRGMELGQIHWVSFDLTHPALAAWEGRGNFIASLLEFPEKSTVSTEKHVRGMERGFDDMAGQLRSALDNFNGIRPPSFGLLILIFALYLALIGPGCWFLCRKLPRGGEAASWISFFLIVAFCCFLFSVLAGNGGETRLNQIQVTDFIQENGTLRQALWGNVWSPEASRLDVSLAPAEFDLFIPEKQAKKAGNANGESGTETDSCPRSETESETRLAWFGLPGNYLGGMNSKITEASNVISSWKASYRMENGKMEDVPFLARSTKSFCAERWLKLSKNSQPQFASLRLLENARVLGEIRNPLDIPLENCLLCCGNWAYEIGRLEPGASFLIDETTPYFAAAALLVEADFLEDHSLKSSVSVRRVNRPYQPDSKNAAYVMRTMLFYEKAGGKAYAGLNHQYQRFLDVSALLNCRTAVLVCQIPKENTSENVGKDNKNSRKATLFTNFTLKKHGEKEFLPLDDPRDQDTQILRVIINPQI